MQTLFTKKVKQTSKQTQIRINMNLVDTNTRPLRHQTTCPQANDAKQTLKLVSMCTRSSMDTPVMLCTICYKDERILPSIICLRRVCVCLCSCVYLSLTLWPHVVHRSSSGSKEEPRSSFVTEYRASSHGLQQGPSLSLLRGGPSSLKGPLTPSRFLTTPNLAAPLSLSLVPVVLPKDPTGPA